MKLKFLYFFVLTAFFSTCIENGNATTSNDNLYIKNFIENLIFDQANNIEKTRKYYAKRVHWFDKGSVSINSIMRKKIKNTEKWPYRDYKISRLKIENIEHNLFRVGYIVRYKLRSYEDSNCGYWASVLLIKTIGASNGKIIAQTGEDLNKECSYVESDTTHFVEKYQAPPRTPPKTKREQSQSNGMDYLAAGAVGLLIYCMVTNCDGGAVYTPSPRSDPSMDNLNRHEDNFRQKQGYQ